MSESRESFEKWAADIGLGDNLVFDTSSGYVGVKDMTWQAWQAAQAQASKPIAAVDGWFHGECVIRPLDPEAVLPAGMALYSQPQAQAGDGEAVGVIDYAFMAGVALTEEGASLPHGTKLYTAPPAAAGGGESVGWQYQHEDTGRTTFVTHAEAAAFEELNPRWYKAMQLYTAPQAAVNQQLLEALKQILGWRELRSGANEVPIGRIEDLARAAIAAAQEQSK